MSPEDWVDTVLTTWTNIDDDVVLVEPTLKSLDEQWRVEFTDGTALIITVEPER